MEGEIVTTSNEVKPGMSLENQHPPDHHSFTGHIKDFPPGYRFKPTHEELLTHYLRKRIKGQILPQNSIHDVDVYQYNPLELSEKFEEANANEGEWYFFSPREKKYRNGTRPKRGASNGYWKATGADKIIMSFEDGTTGLLKTLVYYEGTPKEGTKTGWIMKEYRIGKDDHDPVEKDGSMKLDDWVLYKIYEKISRRSAGDNGENNEQDDQIINIDEGVGHPQYTFLEQLGLQLPHHQEQPADTDFVQRNYNQQNNNAVNNISISHGAAQQQQPQQQIWHNQNPNNTSNSLIFANDSLMEHNHHMHGGGFYQQNYEMRSSNIYNQQPGNLVNMPHDPTFNGTFQDFSQPLMPAAPAVFNNVHASNNESNVPQQQQHHQQSQMMTRPSPYTNFHPYY